MASQRLIDQTPPRNRAKDVEILVLGFSRTGTMSLKVALEKLGYKVYHMSEACYNTRHGHLTFWSEALRAKLQNQGKPFGREQFDKFLGDYNVLEDIPSIVFTDELLEAYPDAKVILTNRDVDSWLKSMKATFFTVIRWKTMPTLEKRDTVFWGPYMYIIKTITAHWGAGDPNDRLALRHTYVNHYAHVRKVVPREKLLEFESKQGWEPLCAFLGKDVPDEPYPCINDAATTVKTHNFIYYYRIYRMLQKPLMLVSTIAIIGLGYWIGFVRRNAA